VTHKELKQIMGLEDSQSRVKKAVKRQAPFAILLLSLVKLWYITEGYRMDPFHEKLDPWSTNKAFLLMICCVFSVVFPGMRVFFNTLILHQTSRNSCSL
jgi:hypothetical protein